MALLLALGIALSPLAASLPRLGLQARVELHLGLKIVGMAVALAISLLTWNTRQGQPTNFVLAGFGYFAIAILGGLELMLLALAPGVTFFDEGPLSIALQLSADGAAAAAFMTAALGPSRPASERAIRLGTVLTAALVLLSLGLELSALQGSPSIARASAGIEMVLAALVLVAAGLFLRRAQRGELAFGLLSRAALFAAIGIAFGTYLPLGDLSKGLFSGAFKALAWLLVYRALFLEGVLEPWHRLVESGRAVEEDRQRYRQLFETTPDGLLLVDATGTIVDANPAAAAMFGWSATGVTGVSVEALIPQHLQARHESERMRFVTAPRTRPIESGRTQWAVRRNGESFPVEVARVPQTFSGGHTALYIVRDVTERQRLEQSLLRQALHDPLTELPNRRHFLNSLTKALARAERHGGTLAVLFIDLDHFKHVNDTHGHSHGDELLRQVARRLSETLRAGDLLARMGGDEFALLLQDAKADDAAAVASKVLSVLEQPIFYEEQTMKVGASVGITLFPADGRKVEELLSNADLAMYRAKGDGRNAWSFFKQDMTERARARSLLQQDLSQAIERGQLSLEFQPRVRAVDGMLTGFEALLRWKHPRNGMVSPDVFIKLAEESGQIATIGAWVLRESCAQAARWRDAGVENLTMAVNVSTHQLRQPAFARHVEQTLAETGWPAGQLELEITESALMEDPAEAAQLLRSLAALGVRLAVDDFGTGYSSLAYLKDFPLHRLKVDRSFVRGLPDHSTDRVIASSIVQLAKALGLQVTAEGVETPQQREFLEQQQCDELQGYLFSAPISAAACEAWMAPLRSCQDRA